RSGRNYRSALLAMIGTLACALSVGLIYIWTDLHVGTAYWRSRDMALEVRRSSNRRRGCRYRRNGAERTRSTTGAVTRAIPRVRMFRSVVRRRSMTLPAVRIRRVGGSRARPEPRAPANANRHLPEHR